MPPRSILLTPTHPLRRTNNLHARILRGAHKPSLAPNHRTIIIRPLPLVRATALTLDFMLESHGRNIRINMTLRIDLHASIIGIALGALDLSLDSGDEVEVAIEGGLGG